MKNAHFTDMILRLLFPPRCAVCDEVLPYTKLGELCDACSKAVDEERKTVCDVCGRQTADCICRVLNDGCVPISLMFYLGDKSRVTEQMVFSLKEDKTSTAYRYFARELSREILKSLAVTGEKPDGYAVTYVPRSKSNLAKYGFDQGERLAKAVAEYTGMAFARVFCRTSSAEQKSLSADERKTNAETIALSAKADANGKRIFVVDDIITTGATVNAASKLLTDAGAVTVKVASVFRTMPSEAKKQKKEKKDEPLWFEE